ncbi:hypothetical protein GCM10027036_19040 [Flavihumibacter cheonanensis]|uniref:ligand-binding sensor domain-containing protein n=1 Tax=Flavihumibacter cheonanensis TaxID=1442385 RepID=UPI001EF823B7|nr:sensor histidine kinase [Flavihumibacter cheonanensis]MCG7754039.1 histidine kinase [Flavihumibacter cheonanensis]
MSYLHKPSVLFLLLMGLALPASSQPLFFENYSSRQGLSQHNCTSIAQDNFGFIWIGTIDGLNRYDGNTFKVFLQQNEAGKKLPSNAVYSLYFDTVQQLLWIGTARGLTIYDPKGDSLALPSHFFRNKELDLFRAWRIKSFKPGEFWFITTNNGLIHFNSTTGALSYFFQSGQEKYSVTDIVLHQGRLLVSDYFKLYELQPAGATYQLQSFLGEYRFPQIRTMASTGNQLWIGTISKGCYFIKDDPRKTENIIRSELVFGGIEAIGKGNGHDLWIYTRGSGIYRYNTRSETIERAIQQQANPSSPISNFGACIFTDRQGIVWLGASGGLVKYDTLRYQFTTVTGSSSLKNSLADNAAYTLFRTSDGDHFVGTQGKGLFQWDVQTQSFKAFPGTSVVGNANNVIYSITEDSQGKLWSATCGGLMQVDKNTAQVRYFPEQTKKQHLNKMYAVIKLKNTDSLLVGTDDGLQFFSLKNYQWQKLTETNLLDSVAKEMSAFRSAQYFYEEADGTVWICNGGVGLMKLNYAPLSVQRIQVVNQLAKGVRSIVRKGPYLLVGTNNGLLVYDDKKNKIVRQVFFRPADQSSVCHAIQTDSDGTIWVSSNQGLVRLNADFSVMQEYNRGNGLSFSEFNPGCSMADSDGRLYFGGMDGITVFYPRLIQKSTFSPRPVITSLLINNKPFASQRHPDLVQQLTLSHKNNFVTIGFAVPNYSKESNCFFSYRLKGLSDDWSRPSRVPEAVFTSVPPGSYEFELRSSNSDGLWSYQHKTLSMKIKAAWWQEPWLQVAVLCLVLASLVFLYQKRIQKLKQEALLRNQMAEIEIKGLHTQMNPHFIFNALNSIKEMIWKDDKRNASKYLSKFALLIRTSLEHSRQPFITIRQCIDHLEQYLQMEKLRFDDFNYRIEVDEELLPEDTRIAPMLIQPLVENAIWHGLRSKKQDRQLIIRFSKKAVSIICEVDDNGVGIRQTLEKSDTHHRLHQSVGIENIKERLAVLNEKYKMNCSLRITDKSDLPGYSNSGTLAILELSA